MVADGVNGVKITGKYICQSVKKLSLFIFCHAPKQNISPSSYDYPPPLPSRRKLLISPEQPFLGICFFPAEGELWSAKNDQN